MTLPNWLFVTEKKNNDGSTWLDANHNQEDCVDDDGTVHIVGNYKLIKKVKLRKGVQFVLPSPRNPRKRKKVG